MPAPLLRLAAHEDVAALAALARRTFHKTFVEGFRLGYPQDDLEKFFELSYAVSAVEAWIASPLDRVYVLDLDGVLVGYAHAGANSLPYAKAARTDGELKRLYLEAAAQGQGLGKRLLETCLNWLGERPVFIGVWKHNARAIQLYRRYGFEPVGEYGFRVGETRDEEIILCRSAGGDANGFASDAPEA